MVLNKNKNLNINDHYDVLLDWREFKSLVSDIDKDLEKFYGPSKIKVAGVRARKKMIDLRERILGIRKKINKQRQDYESEY